MARRIGWPNGLLAAAAVVLVGCGVPTGYAPTTAPVHHGQPAGPPPPAADPDSLTLVTWNIQYGRHLDRALAALRADPHLARADVLCLQELDRAGAARLANSLGFFWAYGLASVHPRTGRPFGNAVLSRYPLHNPRVLTLPHPEPWTGRRRIAVAVDLDPGRGRILRVVSVHTSTVVAEQARRLDQAAAALDRAAGDGPAVVAGDFNTVSAWEVTLLRRAARRAGFRPARLPPGGTHPGWHGLPPGRSFVLDHVFVRGWEVGSRGVGTADVSDHRPVWTVLGWPARKEN